MKIPFLIILLVLSTSANANDDKDENSESQNTKKVDTIWIEEKISPTTTWIENLVKPLTSWMERQVNGSEQEGDNQGTEQKTGQRNEYENDLDSTLANPKNLLDRDLLIGSEKAGVLAKEHIAGEVLYIKLVSKTKQYRVKLISELGEIHIIYIQAVSGEIITPRSDTTNKPVDQFDTTQNNVSNKRP